jgi:hypothetical protein
MNTDLQPYAADKRALIEELRRTLDVKYSSLRKAAQEQWERNFRGMDPSDSCVSVRVASGDPPRLSLPTAGILRGRRRSLLNGGGRPSLA